MSQLSDLVSGRFGLESDVEPVPVSTEPLAAILGRRSYRRYRDEVVTDELRAALLACAQSASAKSDLQQYSIIDIRDQPVKDELAELSSSPFIAKAPVVLVFCGDINRLQRISSLRGLPYTQNTLDNFMNAAVDAALAMQSFVLAAESQGLGCCCISHVRNDMDAVSELLSLPKGVFPMAGLTAGWPGEERDVSLRLPPAVVVHRDAYNDDTLADEIDAYDQRRHEARAIPEAGYLHGGEFELPEFYGWSEHVARRLAKPGGLEGLRAFLESHGFELA